MTDEYLTDFLKALPGKAFCHPCLTDMMAVPIDDIRGLTKGLRVADGFTMSTAACSSCEEQRAVVGYRPAA